jgi:hypothetical protein
MPPVKTDTSLIHVHSLFLVGVHVTKAFCVNQVGSTQITHQEHQKQCCNFSPSLSIHSVICMPQIERTETVTIMSLLLLISFRGSSVVHQLRLVHL